VYRDVVAPERIVCPACCAEEEGNLVAPAHDGLSAAWPAETLVTVTFAGHAGTTRLTLQQSVLVRRPLRKKCLRPVDSAARRSTGP
jgi:hypothetical protein